MARWFACPRLVERALQRGWRLLLLLLMVGCPRQPAQQQRMDASSALDLAPAVAGAPRPASPLGMGYVSPHSRARDLQQRRFEERRKHRIPRPHAQPLPEPKHGAFGCRSSPEQRASCARTGKDCELDSPPGYWQWPSGPTRGARMTKEDHAYAEKELAQRRLPKCMCTCDEEYERLFLDDVASRAVGPPV